MKMNSTDKIDIEGISDNFRYATMAFLVDKKEFIADVEKTRKAIGLSGPLSDKKAKDWLCRKTKEPGLRLMDEKDKLIFNQKFWLENRIASIKERFHLSYIYTKAIRCAILTGKITDTEYTWTAFCEEYPFSTEFMKAEFEVEQPMVAIFVNPETKRDEVLSLFNTKVKELFENIYKNRKKPKRTSSNIRRDRCWYWLHREGKSYRKIADLKNKNVVGFREVVIKAIKQYRKNLGMEK